MGQLLTFLVSILFCFQSYGEDCLFTSTYNGAKFIYVTTDANSSKDQSIKLDSSFASVIPLLKYFALPEEVKVNMNTESVRLNGYADDNLILFGTKEHKIPEGTDPVLAHEYGHLIFGNEKNISKILTPEEYKIAQEKVALAPYDEFFADVVAVLATKDGSSMYNAFKDQPKDRDFTSNGVATTKEEPKKAGASTFKDAHYFFFNTRQFIWKKFEAEGKSEEAGQEILRKTYLAIGKSIKNRIQTSKRKSLYMTSAEYESIDNDLLNELQKQDGQATTNQ